MIFHVIILFSTACRDPGGNTSHHTDQMEKGKRRLERPEVFSSLHLLTSSPSATGTLLPLLPSFTHCSVTGAEAIPSKTLGFITTYSSAVEIFGYHVLT